MLASIEAHVNEGEECIQELEEENDKFKQINPHSFRTIKFDEDGDEIVDHLSFALQLIPKKDISKVRDDIDDTKALLDLIRGDHIG
nr:uncharacterized protein CTRU02_11787 [Colletotrichum truncatum]KAF6785487.1 hypothetical protein CTRU02_11787 [Colletotrichum truncatum]